jgi:hypothetical protein
MARAPLGVEHRVRGEHRRARLGEALADLLLDPLDAGPMETRLSTPPQCGQALGLGMEKPVRWQTRRPE